LHKPTPLATPKRPSSSPSYILAMQSGIWSVRKPSEPVKHLLTLAALLRWLSVTVCALLWCVCIGRWRWCRTGELTHGSRAVAMICWMASQTWRISNRKLSDTLLRTYEMGSREYRWKLWGIVYVLQMLTHFYKPFYGRFLVPGRNKVFGLFAHLHATNFTWSFSFAALQCSLLPLKYSKSCELQIRTESV
jgi:hypothetical protein